MEIDNDIVSTATAVGRGTRAGKKKKKKEKNKKEDEKINKKRVRRLLL